jgi:hypothetical protein
MSPNEGMGSRGALSGRYGAICAVAMAAALAAPASALAADSSGNVKRVASIPEMRAAISINFIGQTMFVSTVEGVYSYDVSKPERPRRLDSWPMYIWENEDVDVDRARKRLFVSRDPRGFTTPAVPGVFPVGAVHVLDVSDPRHIKQVGFFTLPAGHTTTCVNRCDAIWTAGPVAGVDQPRDWKGRPVFATDVRDPANPKPCPAPIDMRRNDGVTDYAHDVQVDSAGVAWVSGAGGVRGYWTEGRHRNPLSGRVERATACKPVPYAGSGTPAKATPSRFMHNSLREPRAHKRVLYATEENISPLCSDSGRFTTYDLKGTFNGQGWRNTARTHHRMRVLDTWTPEQQEGASGCSSAHYFSSRGDGVFANAFYEQGVRFLDVSNPRSIRQIGWYRPADSNTWAAYWHRGFVFVADLQRGVDVLRFRGRPGARTSRAAPDPDPVRFTRMDPASGYLCPRRPSTTG